MTDLNAALMQQFLHVSVTQGKAVVEPNSLLDDSHRETVAIGFPVSHGGSAYPDPVKATQPRRVFLAELLLNAAPFDQETLRSALSVLRRARAYRKLARHYAAQRTLMAEVGETLPERWQDFLAPV
ncbi:hypothetical protein [Deinococcus sp. UYEF24]